MYVIKREGTKEPVMFDKITERVHKLCYGLNSQYVNAQKLTMAVVKGIYDGVSTTQ